MDEQGLATLRRDLAALETDRRSWETTWKDIRDFIIPHRGRFPGDGEKANEYLPAKMEKVVDSTPYRARRILASGMHSGLTSPSRPWFGLLLMQTADSPPPDYATDVWLNLVEDKMRRVLSMTNFYNAVHSLYEELSAFGIGAMFCDYTGPNKLHFHTLTVGEYWCSSNAFGVVDTLYYRFYMTAEAMRAKYGEKNLSDRVKQLVTKKPYDQVELIQCVRPAKKEDATMLPYASVVFEYASTDKVLEEMGFNEFPFFVPRWDVLGLDAYGYGPGFQCLPDVKMLQEVAKDRLKALKKLIDPPLTMPSSLKDRIKTFPGGINFVDLNQRQAAGALYQVSPDMNGISSSIEDVRRAIRDGFFNDLFMMLSSEPSIQPITAREVAEKHEEKLLQLGPVIERLHFELLRPLVDRVFFLLLRNKELPIPPTGVEGQEIVPEFISVLAQAQKMTGIQPIEAVLSMAGNIAQFDQSVLDNVDPDVSLTHYAELVGAPTKILRDSKLVARIRVERAKQAQEQAAMQQAQVGADVARTMAETPMDRASALTALTGGQNGPIQGA